MANILFVIIIGTIVILAGYAAFMYVAFAALILLRVIDFLILKPIILLSKLLYYVILRPLGYLTKYIGIGSYHLLKYILIGLWYAASWPFVFIFGWVKGKEYRFQRKLQKARKRERSANNKSGKSRKNCYPEPVNFGQGQ
ncbi:hypothetical protein [Halobacillus trueperi]|uniref:hypothetical protein n=1 Tax=Halobacillus trueperi TaxID=156205 RepID=UPI003735F705